MDINNLLVVKYMCPMMLNCFPKNEAGEAMIQANGLAYRLDGAAYRRATF